ncbi:MAG TPA: hypothetical protein EYH34_00715 [Planctomycetes bacterium]|nr:hypothetical protein [Planctomycetota bacterium]
MECGKLWWLARIGVAGVAWVAMTLAVAAEPPGQAVADGGAVQQQDAPQSGSGGSVKETVEAEGDGGRGSDASAPATVAVQGSAEGTSKGESGQSSDPSVIRVSQPSGPVRLRVLEPERALGQGSGDAASGERAGERGKSEGESEPAPAADPPTRAEPGQLSATASDEVKPLPAEPQPTHSLQPTPDPQTAGPVEVETASFNGVTPGVTTAAKLNTLWGEPSKTIQQAGKTLLLYRMDEFPQVEVTLRAGKVQAIVVRLQGRFPARTVAEQLELGAIRPVLVADDKGNILGQAFPERGVMFAFEPSPEPGKTTMQVTSVILEPVTAESFVLRAETYLEAQTELSLADLDQAIQLDPLNHRAYWLRARVLAALGRPQEGGISSDKAVELEPSDAQYRVTRSQILGQVGRYAEAAEEAERALADCQKRPHVKARALCLLGDLAASGDKPDYKKAFRYHSEAIKAASQLVESPYPAVRIAAKKVLLDAHLGAANDIAWGFWDQKEKAVPRWLEQAEAIAEEMISQERASRELRMRVATRALTACVGLEGKVDPTPWVEKCVSVGEELLAAADSPLRRKRLQWDLALALYDAVQTYQMRGEHAAALGYGQRSAEYFQQGQSLRGDSVAEQYLVGRLYFRLGAIYSIGKADHKAAIEWFEKALAVFDQLGEKLPGREKGRLGETFVSMAVSYWDMDQKERALQLTQRGVQLLEEAVRAGLADRQALEVPYSNLATMHRELGHADEAQRFLELATRPQATQTK